MKYWFFDGSDVVGPFSLKELAQNKAFSENSLVCPENFSDDGDHWQVAATFDELKSLFALQHEEKPTTLEQEMDTLLNERSPLAFDETPSEGPGLQIPKKPAKPGPIEDYFNRIKEEDLGDILGIPNPNDDSDMDLAHALEKQLAKTSSTRRREREQELESETDQQTATELNQTHHVATATEVFATKAPMAQATPAKQAAPAQAEQAPAKELTMPLVESPTLPTLEPDPATPQAVTPSTPEGPISNEPQELVTQAPAPTTPAQTAEVAPQQPKPAPHIVPDPSQLRREKVEVNSIRARLKQTQEMKDILHETQSQRIDLEKRTHNRVVVMLLTLLAIIGGLLLAFELRTQEKPTASPPTSTAQELLAETPAPAPQPLPASAPQPTASVVPAATQEQQALNIVKNHPLSDKRGTLANYLSRIYQSQLAQGYSGTWAAEPLYKNTYIVKYRLTKTRKEPIIYVFQADVAQGKLTGALNNISLDLVGKL